MKPSRIFVDLDDVLNKFTMSALEELGCPVGADDIHWYHTSWGYDILRAFNELHPSRKMSCKSSLWAELSHYWWTRKLPMTRCAHAIIEVCRQIVGRRNVYVMTSPTCKTETASWKIEWVQRKMQPWLWRNVIINEHKYLCANSESLLIDDYEHNTFMFCQNHGQAILVPRPWNTLSAMTEDWEYYLVNKLVEIRDEQT